MSTPDRIHITVSGARQGEFVITEERPSGEMVIAPATSAGNIQFPR